MYRTIEQKHGVDPRRCAPQQQKDQRSKGLRVGHVPGLGLEKEHASASAGSSDSEVSDVGSASEADAIAQLRQMATDHGNNDGY